MAEAIGHMCIGKQPSSILGYLRETKNVSKRLSFLISHVPVPFFAKIGIFAETSALRAREICGRRLQECDKVLIKNKNLLFKSMIQI